jgi:hypothetical protein
MTRLMIGALLAGLLAAVLTTNTTANTAAETCFLKGEKESGQNKICYYDCVSGEAAITIKSTRLCPLSIKR